MEESKIYQDHISSSDIFKDVTTRPVTSSGVRERAKIRCPVVSVVCPVLALFNTDCTTTANCLLPNKFDLRLRRKNSTFVTTQLIGGALSKLTYRRFAAYTLSSAARRSSWLGAISAAMTSPAITSLEYHPTKTHLDRPQGHFILSPVYDQPIPASFSAPSATRADTTATDILPTTRLANMLPLDPTEDGNINTTVQTGSPKAPGGLKAIEAGCVTGLYHIFISNVSFSQRRTVI